MCVRMYLSQYICVFKLVGAYIYTYRCVWEKGRVCTPVFELFGIS